MSAFSIRTLQPGDGDRLLEFERANRNWFETLVDPRGDAFYTRDGVHAHIAHYLAGYANATWHPCVIVDQAGAIIGRANLKDIDLARGLAEIGYRIGQRHTGNGLASQAVRYLRAVGAGQWGLQRLEARVTIDNAASARVLEKCGFTRGARVPAMALVQQVMTDGYLFHLQLAHP